MKTFLAFTSLRRIARNLALLTIVLALAFLAACAPEGETSRGVQLVLNTEALQPSTTFELRFDQPVIDIGEIGKSNVLSPLLITPKLQGRFTWLSQRSGVFTPVRPLPLGNGWRWIAGQGLPVAGLEFTPYPTGLGSQFANLENDCSEAKPQMANPPGDLADIENHSSNHESLSAGLESHAPHLDAHS